VYLSTASFHYYPQQRPKPQCLLRKNQRTCVQITLTLQSKGPESGSWAKAEIQTGFRFQPRVVGSADHGGLKHEGKDLERNRSRLLSKIYHRSKTLALADITLTIRRGEIFTLLGRNVPAKPPF